MIHPQLARLLQLVHLRGPGAQARFLMMNLAELDPMPLGPGWFDSSWELERGLDVNEDVKLDAASQARLEDAMIQSALARLRSSAARAARSAALASKNGATPVAPAPSAVAIEAVVRRSDNLIEFDAQEAGAWKLPPRRSLMAKVDLPELELSLA